MTWLCRHLGLLVLLSAGLQIATTTKIPELDSNFKSYELTNVSAVGPVDGNLEVNFLAFGEKFNLKLHIAFKKDINVVLVSKYGQRSLDIEPAYFAGNINGIVMSFAHGTLEGAAFSGSIYVTGSSNDDVIYVEPLCRFVKKSCSGALSVVYRRSEVRLEHLKEAMQYKRAPAAAHSPEELRANKQRGRRQKRALPAGSICQVYFTVDHTFYQLYANSDPRLALSETCFFIMEAGKVFEDTDFDGDGSAEKIGFDLRGLKIYETADAPQYKMAGELDGEEYLDKYSEYDFGEYCLAVAFTHRDFADGLLGLAWVGAPTAANKAGGICQHRLPFASYNTLFVTSFNFGSTVSKAVISQTLTHEFGHSFGSDHDDENDAVCSPSNSNGGKYIMHPFSTDTNRPNNWLFSPCSRNQINPVIADKATCFVAQKQAFCGDGMIDEGEDCDCGPAETCAQVDPCCDPGQCVLKSGAVCTPLDITKPCCTLDCQASSPAQLCRLGGECKQDSYCDGSSAICPEPVLKADGVFCYGNTAVCDKGSCSKSLCQFLGLGDCQCGNELDLCFVCCQDANGDCVSVEKADPNQNTVNASVPSVPGQACNDYKGFCDENGQCRKTGKKGAQDRLNKFLHGGMWKRWFANYGLFIGLSVAVLVLAAIALKTVLRKKKMGKKSPAYTSAKIALLWKEANEQSDYLVEKLQTLQKEYREFVEDEFVFSYNSMTDTEVNVSVAKLSVLFPTVPEDIVRRRVKKSLTEEQVVETLLKDGKEMRKIL